MITIDKIIGAIGALSSILAAVFWLRSALLEVPDNIDTIVRELQRIGWWNSVAAWAAVVASLCAAWIFVTTQALGLALGESRKAAGAG